MNASKQSKLAKLNITPGCHVCRLTARPDGRPLLEPTTAQPVPYTPRSIGDALLAAGLDDYEYVRENIQEFRENLEK